MDDLTSKIFEIANNSIKTKQELVEDKALLGVISDVVKAAIEVFRNDGKVPCVMYGGKEQIHFSLYESDFKQLLFTDKVYKVLIDLDDKKIDTILQGIEFHPVSDLVLHADFMEIATKERVKLDMPVRLVGTAPGLQEGGMLRLKLRKMKVIASPDLLPDAIEVNIDNLQLGDTIHVRDITLDNIEVLTAPGIPVVSVIVPKGFKEIEEMDAAAAEAAAEAAEGEEGAEGEVKPDEQKEEGQEEPKAEGKEEGGDSGDASKAEGERKGE